MCKIQVLLLIYNFNYYFNISYIKKIKIDLSKTKFILLFYYVKFSLIKESNKAILTPHVYITVI